MTVKKDSTKREKTPRGSVHLPHPTEREKPLPGDHPKSAQDDGGAPEGVQKLLASASYRQADEDLDFLQEPQQRGVRLQLEYIKAETLLEEYRVAHTIVIFGGTRILEHDAAKRAVEKIEEALRNEPGSGQLKEKLSIAQRVLEKSKYYDMARELGQIVGRAEPLARGDRIIVMTGGGPGIMEAANRGACYVGARSAGLNITLPHEQYPNPYITPELCLRFHYFAMRKFHLVMRARALVAFPGGFGTLDEVFEVLALSQTRKMPPVPVVLVGEDYWKRVFDADFLVDEGVIDPEDLDLFLYANSAEEAWQGILRWYEMKGEPLLRRGQGTP